MKLPIPTSCSGGAKGAPIENGFGCRLWAQNNRTLKECKKKHTSGQSQRTLHVDLQANFQKFIKDLDVRLGSLLLRMKNLRRKSCGIEKRDFFGENSMSERMTFQCGSFSESFVPKCGFISSKKWRT
jgi:hypothetical protein